MEVEWEAVGQAEWVVVSGTVALGWTLGIASTAISVLCLLLIL